MADGELASLRKIQVKEKCFILCYDIHTQDLNKYSKCIKLNFSSLRELYFICSTKILGSHIYSTLNDSINKSVPLSYSEKIESPFMRI